MRYFDDSWIFIFFFGLNVVVADALVYLLYFYRAVINSQRDLDFIFCCCCLFCGQAIWWTNKKVYKLFYFFENNNKKNQVEVYKLNLSYKRIITL